MTAVLTALGNRWDSAVATHLEASRQVRLVRRCADLADLMATAASGLGSVAMVSEDLRGLDLSVVAGLRESGILVVGLSVPGDEGSERRLRQLGIPVVVPADSDLPTLEEAVTAGPTLHGLPGFPDIPGTGRVSGWAWATRTSRPPARGRWPDRGHAVRRCVPGGAGRP